MTITYDNFITVSVLLFMLGLLGLALNRQHLIKTLLSLELLLLSSLILFITFSHYHHHMEGQLFSLIILAIAAAEIALGLAIVISYYRQKQSIFIEDITELKE